MTEKQLELKLRNENVLLRVELAVLEEQERRRRTIDSLRAENRKLNEKVSAAQLRIQRQYRS